MEIDADQLRDGADAAKAEAAAVGEAAAKVRDLASAYRALQGEQAKLSSFKATQAALSAAGSTDIGAHRAVQAQIDESSAKVSGISTHLATQGGGVDYAKAARDEDQASRAAEQDTKKRADAEKEAAGFAARADAERARTIQAVGSAARGTLATIVKLGAASAGVHGIGDLTKLAAGYQGMAKLQMIEQRAAMDARRLFTGVDPSPLVRAAGRLETNLSRSTITGAALSSVLQRGFTGAFGMAERLEPVLSGAFQLGVLGAVQLENELLKLELAAVPLTVAWEEFQASEAGAAATTTAISAAIAALGAVVDVATTPLRELTSQLQLFSALKKAIDSGGTDERGVMEALGQKYQTASLDRMPEKATGGRETGRDIGAGIVAGLADKEGEVAAGGAKLARAAVTSARTEVGAHSPADATIALGHDLSSGAVVGMDAGAGDVQRAAERSLVPDVSSVGRGAPRGGGDAPASSPAASGPAQITITNNFPNITSGSKEALDKAATEAFRMAARQLAMQLGLPIVGTS